MPVLKNSVTAGTVITPDNITYRRVLKTTRSNRFYNFLVSDTANASKAVKRFVDQKMESSISKVEALQYFFDIFNYNQYFTLI